MYETGSDPDARLKNAMNPFRQRAESSEACYLVARAHERASERASVRARVYQMFTTAAVNIFAEHTLFICFSIETLQNAISFLVIHACVWTIRRGCTSQNITEWFLNVYCENKYFLREFLGKYRDAQKSHISSSIVILAMNKN